MISHTHRFHGLGSLKYVYAKGKTVRSASMSLRFAPNTRRTTWRVAVVVSKKVHKSAVKRNRIRRRIYEIVRTARIAEQFSTDIVIIVYDAQVLDMTPQDLQDQIYSLLKQAKLR